MSCVHYLSTDPSRDRCYGDVQNNRYVSPSYTPRIRTPESYRSGYHVGWRPLEFRARDVEHPTAGRVDSTYPDPRMQPGRTTPCQQETAKQTADVLIFEKMQTRMKLLEDSNFVMQSRNQNLIAENKALSSRVEEERNEVKRHEKRVAALLEELDREKFKLEETINAAERTKNVPAIAENGTSTTNILSKLERGVQVWAVCMGCQKKLENGAKQPPTVTITKSELEILEKDMQTLRDTIIAREEAWDKAIEREQNYRQQLTRLTTETITARHLSETRQEELREATKTLSEKESELKSLQNVNMHLNKILAKLYNNHQSRRAQEECQRNNLTLDINEKEQRFIEEAVRRVLSTKGKQKSKSKNTCLDKTSNSYAYQSSPRDKSSRATKDPAGSFKESKC